MTELKLTIEDVAIYGSDAKYTPYGYIIAEDGLIYSMTRQYVHGTILALLFPEKALEEGYEPPTRDYNVYHYQNFELDHSHNLPIVRVSISISGLLNISKSDKPITKEQRMALSKVFATQGIKLQQQVNTEGGEMTASKALEWLSTFDREEELKKIENIELIVPDEFK